MANPNPQHTPTDGLGVLAIVLVAGTNVAKVGSQVSQSAGITPGGHQYAVTLSLSSQTVTVFEGQPSSLGSPEACHPTCQLTPQAVDVKGNDYTPVNSATYKSYNYPSFSGYNPSNAISGNGLLANQVAYSALVASVSGSGLITAHNVGQAIIEVQYPTFDDVMTPETDHDTGDPTMMVFSQIIVTVVP
jgi:hypothetical protein